MTEDNLHFSVYITMYFFTRHANDISILQQQFQAELKTAFSSDSASLELLNRVQDLEMEIERTRKECESKIKEQNEEHEKETQEMKDDMATVLQVLIAANFS